MNKKLKRKVQEQLESLAEVVPPEERQRLEDLRRSFGEIRHEMNALIAENEHLKQKLEESAPELDRQKKALSNSRSQLTRCEQKLAKSKEVIEALHETRDSLQRSLSMLVTTLDSVVTTLQDTTICPPFRHINMTHAIIRRAKKSDVFEHALQAEIILAMILWKKAELERSYEHEAASLDVVVFVYPSKDDDEIPTCDVTTVEQWSIVKKRLEKMDEPTTVR